MNMKKFLMAAVAMLFAGSAMALDNVPQSGPSWVAFGGFTVSNLNGADMNAKVGANLGVKMDYYLPNAKGTYISAGIDWVQKGARETVYDGSLTMDDVTYKIQSHYFELPIHVGFRYNVLEKLGFYGEVGPYFAFGFTGKEKTLYENDLYDDTHNMLFGKHFGGGNIRGIQRFDCGFGFRIGAEYNNQYSLNIGYDWGFTDMYTDKYRKAYSTATGFKLDKLKNHNLSVTFGYRF